MFSEILTDGFQSPVFASSTQQWREQPVTKTLSIEPDGQ